ncbi:hypothetical protein [Flavivirga rizhaonensis]|uniref:CopG family transcriptional regulator n=1 Tax=Flavivirga rizhaonensis TaxID=2559571 RepID=A0A4S1E0S7_9FLAO|nr:hypothetical protein [Flavivirga rizhaonensis]TGV04147.1 hypothetical protein EM932_03135 [Flavivirga rizhaonensis]
MGKTKKLIELDDKAIEILEKQAKIQKRSLKNYIEYMLEDTAARFAEPSEAYKAMMDDMIKKDNEGILRTQSWEAIKAQYGK